MFPNLRANAIVTSSQSTKSLLDNSPTNQLAFRLSRGPVNLRTCELADNEFIRITFTVTIYSKFSFNRQPFPRVNYSPRIVQFTSWPVRDLSDRKLVCLSM